MLQPKLPTELTLLMQEIRDLGGQSFLVGGAVRDFLLNQKIQKDLDVEVFGIRLPDLENLLAKAGKLSKVGKSFGVLKLKLTDREYDFSLPRQEWKIGPGHHGFKVRSLTQMAYPSAALRRDFTINSIAYDPLNHQFLDPFQGKRDLERKILRHIGSSFSEDPLRVLRAMQFSARFEFRVAPETTRLCRTLELDELPKERIFEEFKKLLLLSEKPSRGLETARELGILKAFPEINHLAGIPQDPKCHPEGDVWNHTLRVLDAAATLKTGFDAKDLELMLAALCHDLGREPTTKYIHNRWRSLAEHESGFIRTESFLKRITEESKLIRNIQLLVRDHLRPQQLYNDRESIRSSDILRLALRVSIRDLVRLAHADYQGKMSIYGKPNNFSAGEWLLDQARRLSVQDKPPQPFLKGRHLIEMGIKPGPEIGKLLKQAFDVQINGEIRSLNEAVKWVESKLPHQTKTGKKGNLDAETKNLLITNV